jgi:hypothetical protein
MIRVLHEREFTDGHRSFSMIIEKDSLFSMKTFEFIINRMKSIRFPLTIEHQHCMMWEVSFVPVSVHLLTFFWHIYPKYIVQICQLKIPLVTIRQSLWLEKKRCFYWWFTDRFNLVIQWLRKEISLYQA